MLIVTGAAGQLGQLVVKHLLTHVPAHRIGVTVRNPAAVENFAVQGIRVRTAGYSDPAGLRRAFEGAERVLLISSNASATGGDSLAQHRNVIEAAKSAGVDRLLYTSQVSASPASLFPPGRDHAETERLLAGSGLLWTALRHGYYASSAYMMNQAGFTSGGLLAPPDGKVAWTTHDDLAAVDALLLAGKAQFDGPTPPLTGDAALDLADLAALATDLLGRSIVRKVVTQEAMASALRSSGMPESTVQIVLGYYHAAEAGEFATVNPTLAHLLGRPAATLRSFLEAKLPNASRQLR